MLKKIFYFLFIFFLLFNSFYLSIPKANAADLAECSLDPNLVQDGGDAHWLASHKSKKIWLTINYGPNKNSLPEKVSAVITDKNKTRKIMNEGAGEAKVFQVGDPEEGKGDLKVVYLRDIAIFNKTYQINHGDNWTNPLSFYWEAGTYKLNLIPAKGKIRDKLCNEDLEFTIKPFCTIELNAENNYSSAETNISFKVTEFNPYQADAKVDIALSGPKNLNATRKESALLNSDFVWRKDGSPQKLKPGVYQIHVSATDNPADNTSCDSNKFRIADDSTAGVIEPGQTPEGTDNTPLSQPCSDSDLSGSGGCARIKTGLGYVSTDSSNFTRWVLGFVLSFAGGIVILIIIIDGYRLMTSQGEPEKIKNARDQLTAAIVGLLFIIFSLALLELITRDILGLPGFN